MLAIKQMRLAAGLTQREVANALDISPQRYSNWERGARDINLVDACRLADLFHCTLDELVGREWPEPESDLTAQEFRVLDAYRDADVIERRIIERAAGIDSGGAVAQSDQGVGIA